MKAWVSDDIDLPYTDSSFFMPAHDVAIEPEFAPKNLGSITVDVSGMSEKELLKHMTFQQIIANAANELAAKGMVCPETFSVLAMK